MLERPPLAQELFSDLPIVNQVLRQFPQCYSIIPNLRQATTIENTLEIFQAEGDTEIVSRRRLAAIRFYIQNVILLFDYEWEWIHDGMTNYTSLLDQLRRARRPDEPICIVTFNYDRLIERALDQVGVTIKTIDDAL